MNVQNKLICRLRQVYGVPVTLESRISDILFIEKDKGFFLMRWTSSQSPWIPGLAKKSKNSRFSIRKTMDHGSKDFEMKFNIRRKPLSSPINWWYRIFWIFKLPAYLSNISLFSEYKSLFITYRLHAIIIWAFSLLSLEIRKKSSVHI